MEFFPAALAADAMDNSAVVFRKSSGVEKYLLVKER